MSQNTTDTVVPPELDEGWDLYEIFLPIIVSGTFLFLGFFVICIAKIKYFKEKQTSNLLV